MPDASEHSLSYIERGSLKFGKLSVTDRSRLLREFKTAARAELVAALKDSNLAPEKVYVELRSFDTGDTERGREGWGYQRWLEYLDSFEGQQAIFRTALAKQNDAAKLDDLLASLVLTPADSLELTCQITSVPYQAPTPPAPNMKQVGVINGQAIYVAAGAGSQNENVPTDGDEANPTQPPTPAANQKQLGNPTSYGK